jgi:hypothetical protein
MRKIVVGKLEGKRLLERCRIILKRVVRRQCVKVCTQFMWLRLGTNGQQL